MFFYLYLIVDIFSRKIAGWEVYEREAAELNRPGFTGGQNSRRIARYGTDTKEEHHEAVFT